MKKIIITILAAIMMMTLVSCGEKGEPVVVSHTIEEHFITENVIEEDIIEETIIEEDWVDANGYRYSITRDEYNRLINGYKNGDISKEYMEEVLFNSRIG